LSKFGWWYPPGAANDPNAPYNQTDPPCGVCGQREDDCICPECPTCGGVGDPACYDGAVLCSYCGVQPAGFVCTRDTCAIRSSCDHFNIIVTTKQVNSHGLIRSFGQVALRLEAERTWDEENAATARAEEEADRERAKWEREADRIDGYDRDDLGESPDY